MLGTPVWPSCQELKGRGSAPPWSFGAAVDRRSGWAGMCTAGHAAESPRRGGACGALAAPSGAGEPDARRPPSEVSPERGPGPACFPPSLRAGRQPRSAPAGGRATEGGVRAAPRAPLWEAEGPWELQEPPLVAVRPRCSSRAARLTSEINQRRRPGRSEAAGAGCARHSPGAAPNFPGRVRLPGLCLHGASCWRTEPRCRAFPKERPVPAPSLGASGSGVPASAPAVGAGNRGCGSPWARGGSWREACSAPQPEKARPTVGCRLRPCCGRGGDGCGGLASLWSWLVLLPEPAPRLTCSSHSPPRGGCPTRHCVPREDSRPPPTGQESQRL